MSAKLNEKNYITEKNIHLLVTTLCDKSCKYCCNKQYNLNEIPYVTNEELNNASNIFLTGGEPFKYSNPTEIARSLKLKHKNIENVIVYSGVSEFFEWYQKNGLQCIDGLTLSIKDVGDYADFRLLEKCNIKQGMSLRVYYFDELLRPRSDRFTVIKREWQDEFAPANDSIFRKI